MKSASSEKKAIHCLISPNIYV